MGRDNYSAAMEVLKKIEDFAWMGSDVLDVIAQFMATKKLHPFNVSIFTGVDDEKMDNANQEICTLLAEKTKKKKVVASAVQ